MALDFYIPPCITKPPHPLHLPPPDKPLRIQIEGPLTALQRLLPEISWKLETHHPKQPLPGGPELAKLAYRQIYGRDVNDNIPGDMIVRHEYLGWMKESLPYPEIDYYGVTFDHLVPVDEKDPDVLQININEMEYDGGEYANKYLLFAVDPSEYTGKKVLAVPRCCQKRKGTTDRGRINDGVNNKRPPFVLKKGCREF